MSESVVAAVATWDAKFTDRQWRPFAAIRAAVGRRVGRSTLGHALRPRDRQHDRRTGP